MAAKNRRFKRACSGFLENRAIALSGRAGRGLTTHTVPATVSTIAPIDLASIEREREGYLRGREPLWNPIRLVRMVNQRLRRPSRWPAIFFTIRTRGLSI